jgi:F0F1-type ATP synthase membrane subunit a
MADRKQFSGDLRPDPELAELLKTAMKIIITEEDLPTVLMGVGLYALEIFVSILQAYIFTYLSAMFVGMYLVPEH